MLGQIAVTSQVTDADVEALHRRCGVYTRDSVVCTLLDAVEWTPEFDLSDQRLLEPAAGDGAFVVEAASRLLESMVSRGIELTPWSLVGRICAFEIHPGEAAKARARVIEVLNLHGLFGVDADAVANAWIRVDDFLLADLLEGSFTHVVGNPPYSRWSKIPSVMREQYDAVLPRRMTHGDLFLPFLDLGIGYLKDGGRLGFVCTNRWRFMAFAEGFRQVRLPEVEIEIDDPITSSDAYVRNVDTYPSLLVMRRTGTGGSPIAREGVTLGEAGYEVRVGPALGVTSAFVLKAGEDDVEEGLLVPWISASEIRGGWIDYQGRRLISVYDSSGGLRKLEDYPLARARFERHRDKLEKRSIVRNGAVWYRSIDRVVIGEWRRPKLLIPELSKFPYVALDISGYIPSHGVYAIFASNDDLSALYALLRDGGLAKKLTSIAPRIKGGYIRAYKHILLGLPL